ncbi:transposase [Streptomyces decoyicus]|uniref:transposase n=1 Tax=Streptomyces decoyicus TaxID=249567 RepID=UPI00099BDC2E
MSADGRCRPLSLIVTGGQRADCTQVKAVLEKIRVSRVGPGRPRKKPASVAADKAYSSRPCREYLRRRASGTRSRKRPTARPPACAKAHATDDHPASTTSGSKKRNTIERAINRLKHSRAVAARYDKRGYVCFGTATAAALTIWLRT